MPFTTSHYGKSSIKQHLLSSRNRSGKSSHGIPFGPNAQTVQDVILCSESLKPRVIESQIGEECLFAYKGLLYTCVAVPWKDLKQKRDVLERVYVPENLTYNDPVEVSYYSVKSLLWFVLYSEWSKKQLILNCFWLVQSYSFCFWT